MSTKSKALGAIVAMAAFLLAGVPAGAATEGDPYTLDTCAVSGKALGSMGDPIVLDHDGREIKLCCGGCEKPFNEDSEKYIAAVDAKMIEQQDEHYALETCPISGKALDSKGDPLSIVVANREVKLCCGGCEKPARADAAGTIAKLDEAVIAKQSADYPYKNCPTSGKPIDSKGDPVNMVVANRLVKLCCGGCDKPVLADPLAAFKKLDSE
jgi:hypothetical protein